MVELRQTGFRAGERPTGKVSSAAIVDAALHRRPRVLLLARHGHVVVTSPTRMTQLFRIGTIRHLDLGYDPGITPEGAEILMGHIATFRGLRGLCFGGSTTAGELTRSTTQSTATAIDTTTTTTAATTTIATAAAPAVAASSSNSIRARGSREFG